MLMSAWWWKAPAAANWVGPYDGKNSRISLFAGAYTAPSIGPVGITGILEYLEQTECGAEGGCALPGISNYLLQ